MDADQFRKAAHAAIEEIISYYGSLENYPVVSTVSPGYLRPLLPGAAPEEPEPWAEIQADVGRAIVPGLTHWQHPAFMAFFPATATFPSMLGELYSAAFTAPAFNWLCSPACTELETVVLDWVAGLLGLPEVFRSQGEGGGVIQGSASEAVVTVMVAARERVLEAEATRAVGAAAEADGAAREAAKDGLRGKLVALGSEHAHSSTQKGAIIAGTKYETVPAPRETGYAMTGPALRAKLDDLKARGMLPYYVTVTMGSTATCAVDRFAELAAVKRDFPEVWFHVDAAYAGAALCCDEYRGLIEGVEAFDSFDMNMHKWLLVNFDASCLFLRRRRDLTNALSLTPPYLRNPFTDAGLVTDYRDWQIPLGRRFRALKIWFVLRTYGAAGLRAHIRRTVRLSEHFAALVRAERPDLFAVLTGPAFALTVLTVRPRLRLKEDAEGDVEEANRVTKEVYDRVTAAGRVFLTSTVVGGVYAIRVVSANERASEAWVRVAFEELVEKAEEVLGVAVDGEGKKERKSGELDASAPAFVPGREGK